MSIGGIVTMGLTASLMERYPWREVFGLYTWVGVVWAVGFFCYFRNHPRQHPWVNEAERDLITRPPFSGQPGADIPSSRESRPQSAEDGDLPFKPSPEGPATLLAGMIGSRSLWGICSQQFLRGSGLRCLCLLVSRLSGEELRDHARRSGLAHRMASGGGGGGADGRRAGGGRVVRADPQQADQPQPGWPASASAPPAC